MQTKLSRRSFIEKATVLSAGMAFMNVPNIVFAKNTSNVKPAILGGPKAFTGKISEWPIIDTNDEKALLRVLRSKIWNRLSGKEVKSFEEQYAALLGTKHSLGVSSGTNALYTVLGAVGLGPGDEVILPVYTFIATYNVVVLNYALPILVDTDIETSQIDANKIEAAITPQTKMIMPVHLGGAPCDLDKILEIGNKYNIPVLEDACQSHLAEWKGKKVGTLGTAGAFSFQASKNLNCGDGGAITTNSDDLIDKCYRFHNQGRNSSDVKTGFRGSNLRLTEFQGAILLAQMARLIAQTEKRIENADHLTKLFAEIPGITPAKQYPGTTKSVYHLYMFLYDENYFSGLSRDQFIKAMEAEGVPCTSGYTPMDKDKYIRDLADNEYYIKIYGKPKMKEWLEKIECPQNEILSSKYAVWIRQRSFLGSKNDMEQIATAIRKIQKFASEIKAQ
jgi:dTDP-4-amino-4,6-dideoxygalactose transaminase